MKNLIFSVLGLVPVHLPHVICGQDSIKTIELNPITVTAHRFPQHLLATSRRITVLSSQELKQSPGFNLSALLSALPGLHITGVQQNPGQLQAVFLRGANAGHTQVLVDGIKLSDPTSVDNAVDLSELSLLNLERVEVVGGAHSSIYGSSAIGGVINLITKKQEDPGWHIQAGLQGGTFGSQSSQLSEKLRLNYTHHKGWYANAEVFHAKVLGLDTTVDTSTATDYPSLHRDRDHFKKLDFHAKTGYIRGPWDLFLSATAIGQLADIDDGAYRDDNNYTVDIQRRLYTYGATYRLNSNAHLTLAGGLTRFHRHLLDDSTVIDLLGRTDQTHWESNNYGWSQHQELTFHQHGRYGQVVAGVGHTGDRMTIRSRFYSTTFGPFTLENNLDNQKINLANWYQFIHGEMVAPHETWPQLKLGLSLRHNHHELYGSQFIYALNPSWKILPTLFTFVTFSTAFNAPSLYQLYAQEQDFTSGIRRGNATLRPEKGQSLEWGIKYDQEKWHLQISLYRNMVRENIDFVYLWDGQTPQDQLSYLDYRGDTYLNLGTQTNQGVELSFSYVPHRRWHLQGWVYLIKGQLHYDPAAIPDHLAAYYLQLFANGTFLAKSVNQNGLGRRPGSAFFNVEWLPSATWTTYVGLRHTGRGRDIYYDETAGPFGALGLQSLSAYTLIHSGIKFQPRKSWNIHLRVENLANTRYIDILGYTVRGRSLYGGLNVQF